MEENNNQPQQSYQPQPVQQQPTPAPRPTPSDDLEDRVFAALSYISILFVVPLILKSRDESIHFHAKQGLVLFGAEVVVWFALFLLDTFLTALFPAGESLVVRVLGALAWIGFMALSIAGVYMAARGKQWAMPILGRIAQKLRI